jgi:hypothetical protein
MHRFVNPELGAVKNTQASGYLGQYRNADWQRCMKCYDRHIEPPRSAKHGQQGLESFALLCSRCRQLNAFLDVLYIPHRFRDGRLVPIIDKADFSVKLIHFGNPLDGSIDRAPQLCETLSSPDWFRRRSLGAT